MALLLLCAKTRTVAGVLCVHRRPFVLVTLIVSTDNYINFVLLELQMAVLLLRTKARTVADVPCVQGRPEVLVQGRVCGSCCVLLLEKTQENERLLLSTPAPLLPPGIFLRALMPVCRGIRPIC